MRALLTLFTALPQILRLIESLQEQHKKSEKERKVKQDIERINKAFKEQDAQALKDIFNNGDSK
jgi:hypothetical protein